MRTKTKRLVITELTPDMAQAVHENSLDEDTRRFVPDEVFETRYIGPGSYQGEQREIVRTVWKA